MCVDNSGHFHTTNQQSTCMQDSWESVSSTTPPLCLLAMWECRARRLAVGRIESVPRLYPKCTLSTRWKSVCTGCIQNVPYTQSEKVKSVPRLFPKCTTRVGRVWNSKSALHGAVQYFSLVRRVCTHVVSWVYPVPRVRKVRSGPRLYLSCIQTIHSVLEREDLGRYQGLGVPRAYLVSCPTRLITTQTTKKYCTAMC